MKLAPTILMSVLPIVSLTIGIIYNIDVLISIGTLVVWLTVGFNIALVPILSLGALLRAISSDKPTERDILAAGYAFKTSVLWGNAIHTASILYLLVSLDLFWQPLIFGLSCMGLMGALFAYKIATATGTEVAEPLKESFDE